MLPLIFTIAGFSAVATVSVEIFSTVVLYSLFRIFGFDASLTGDS